MAHHDATMMHATHPSPAARLRANSEICPWLCQGDALAEEASAGAPSSEIYDKDERDAVSYVIETMMSTPKDALKPAPQVPLPALCCVPSLSWSRTTA